MRTAATLAFLLCVSAMAGCHEPTEINRSASTVTLDGLFMTVELSSRELVVGDSLDIVATVRNDTKKPVAIIADSGALVQFRLLRHTGLTWEEVRRYPRNVLAAVTPWTLWAKSHRRFPVRLTVEPDWPVGEVLAVVAELNGRPEFAPRVTVEILPTRPATQDASSAKQ